MKSWIKNIFFKRCIDCTNSLQIVMFLLMMGNSWTNPNALLKLKIEFSFLCVDCYNLKDTKTDKEITFFS